MAKKRKRYNAPKQSNPAPKRQKVETSNKTGKPKDELLTVQENVLAQYYPSVVSLRQYLVSHLPATTKNKRRKIATFALPDRKETDAKESDSAAIAHVLDTTLVGVSRGDENHLPLPANLKRDFDAFVTPSKIPPWPSVVDFAILSLFSDAAWTEKSQNLIRQGFRRGQVTNNAETTGPGLVEVFPNEAVKLLKGNVWTRIFGLLGERGAEIGVRLLRECGVFMLMEHGQGNFYQICGVPLAELPLLSVKDKQTPESRRAVKPSKQKRPGEETLRSPLSITFVRNRMLYGRPATNARGTVRFGLRHIHVLNHYGAQAAVPGLPDSSQASAGSENANTIHVMTYIFPRQFGLHNVFTSNVDSRETVQPFKDYTLREEEIRGKLTAKGSPGYKVPKRLKGKALELVGKMQVLHGRCAYKELLMHYCPVTGPSTTGEESESARSKEDSESTEALSEKTISSLKPVASTASSAVSLLSYATSTAQVSAYCRAVLSSLIPREFWGTGETQALNQELLLRNVDRFIKLRRFESLSLHETLQGMKITNIPWLTPPSAGSTKTSQTDRHKRLEIFHEFIYYAFDSLLIPLLRSTFHITESSTHRYRLFFFRHDVWRAISEPALQELKPKMFEEKTSHSVAQKVLDSRPFGYSHVRLLPKETGFRPIMNLRRRPLRKGSRDMLGSSINSVLAPVHQMLTLEKDIHPERLASTIFSVGDMHARLATFKRRIDVSKKPLYFVKVDIKSAFDTIPQAAVLRLIDSLPLSKRISIAKHTEIIPGSSTTGPPIRRWQANPRLATDTSSTLLSSTQSPANKKRNTIFTESVFRPSRNTNDLLDLLSKHVQWNLVKIGKKYYRQSAGIPQGSVVSSLLCNYFYADLELTKLRFLDPENGVLMRLVDDFLLITTDRGEADRFLQVMDAGVPEYGVSVSKGKTLVNYDTRIADEAVNKLPVSTHYFPYCGVSIDTHSLDIVKSPLPSSITNNTKRKSGSRIRSSTITDGLTIEHSKTPGLVFRRKVLNGFKMQAAAMFHDTSFNSLSTVLANLHTGFVEAAEKMCAYIACLEPRKRPSAGLVVKVLAELGEVAVRGLKRKGGGNAGKGKGGYRFDVSKRQVEWVEMRAFEGVLGRRQSGYGEVVAWVRGRLEGSGGGGEMV